MRHYRVRYHFPIYLLISLGIHFALLFYMVYSYREELRKSLLVKTPKILVDLTEPRNDLYDPDKQVISRYNYAGKGKLVPRKGQHLPGDFNPITEPESIALKKPESRSSPLEGEPEDSRKQSSLNSDKGVVVSQKAGKKPLTAGESVRGSEQKTSSEEKRRLSVDTEDSLENKFWFDESEYLQMSARSHPDAEFSLELAKLLKKRFATYVLSGGTFNFYQVKRDEATALATINSQGEIAFKKIVNPSTTQPYMNYLVSRVLDHPGIVKQLPAEIKEKRDGNLYFLFNIRFTGEPLRKWWLGFEFLPDNKTR